MKNRRRKQRHSPKPDVGSEVLEVRQLLSSDSVVVSFERAAHTLTVFGSEVADHVSISQDDSLRTLTVVTSQADRPEISQQFPIQMIDRIMLRLGAGDDHFEYETVGRVQTAKDISLNLGSGDDTAGIAWAEDRSMSVGSLSLNITAGDGSDAVGARIGRVGGYVKTSVNVDLGSGNDGLAAEALNPTGFRSALSVNVRGGNGNDQILFYGSEMLAGRSSTNVRLDGESGNDSIEFHNQGPINGGLSATIVGGADDDMLTSSAVDGSGSGQYTSSIQGGSGGDTLVVDQRNTGRRSYSVTNSADGGAGDDTVITSLSTRVRSAESTIPISAQTRPVLNEPFYPVLPTSIVKAGTRTIEYWTRGKSDPNAPVVVLLTGAGGAIDSWLPIASSLIGVGQVIAVNKPGFGQTDVVAGLAARYNETVIDDIRAVVARVAPGRQVILVGHSLGGAYANLYARLHPSEVAAVVFEDATQQMRVTQEELAADFLTPVTRLYPVGVRAELNSIAETISAPLDAPDFPAIPVIALSQDLPDEQLSTARELAKLGGLGGTLRVVQDAGHYLHADQPTIVLQAIRDAVRSTEVSGILEDVAAKYGVPGLAASVILGKQVLTGVAGVTAAGSATAVKVSDRFGNGSTTKAMTATLAGILVDRGRLTWDTKIVDVFPELRNSMRPEYLNVTIEQLLQHRGGIIADDDASESLAEAVASYSGDPKKSRLTIAPEILKERPPVPVGTFRYSNGGFVLAAAMMERVTGRDYETLMQRFVFDPLGMKSATFHPERLGNRGPLGHTPDGTPIPNNSPLYDVYGGPILFPAGARLRMNVADWSKFIRMQTGQAVNGVRPLRPETLSRLHQPGDGPAVVEGFPDVGYAMGWETFTADAFGRDASLGASIVHNGSDGFWLAKVEAFPEADFAITIMANATLDKDGNDLESAAFAEIQQRLMHRFASK
jgi:CubicO group peptidase (beta-lactamase class C family)/dienelactone hydrolase